MQPLTAKVSVDFAISALLPLPTYLNAEPIALLERPHVLTAARRARLFALDVESSKSFSLFFHEIIENKKAL